MRVAAALLGVMALSACDSALSPLQPGPPGPPPSPFVCEEEAVGPAPLRRLTREQYQNSVEDLLGVGGDYGQRLAVDERAGAFATNLSTSVDRSSLESYIDAAEAVAADADLRALDDCDLLTETASDCAVRFIRTYGRLLYRRPLDLQEENRLFGLYSDFGADDYLDGLAVALIGMLASPSFLYHDDYTVAGEPSAAMQPLGPYAVAERLAFFLWNSAPDDTLLTAAAEGRLADAAGVREQAERMLGDERARRTVASFHRAWLQLDRLQGATRDATIYPTFAPALVDAMIAETEAFATAVILEGDGSLETLLTASWSIVPEALREHYGLPAAAPTDAPVELEPTQRAGIFTHASFLTAQSHHQTSSLTRRGTVIREEVFCQDLPEPPDGVDLTIPEPAPGATTRQRFEEHRANEACATCHERIDPIGFALESFDAIGRWRDLDQGLPVDTRGDLFGTDVDREIDGPIEMANALAESLEVRRCMARQWFRYALGRRETAADNCSLAAAEVAIAEPYGIRQLIIAIAASDSFRHRPAGETE